MYSDRPHILHVIDSLAPGGAERMAVEIANATDKSRYRVGICVTRSNTTLAKELDPNVPLYVLGRSSRFDLNGMRKFQKLVQDSHVALFHVHGRSSAAFVILARTLYLVRQPILFHDHYGIELNDSIPTWFRVWGKRFVAQYIGVYNRLDVWAQRAGIPPSRITVLENALNLARITNAEPADIRRELNIAKDTIVGVWIGGIRPQKGLDVLIQALHQIRIEVPFVILIIGGIGEKGYYQQCLKWLDTYEIWERVLFLGPRTDIPGILRGGVDFGVVSSVSESGPLVLIEYMAAGIPFVATSVGSISHRAQSLGAPGFVPPGNPAALAGALQELLSLPSRERQERGAVGQYIALNHFDIRLQMPRWYELYEKVLRAGIGS